MNNFDHNEDAVQHTHVPNKKKLSIYGPLDIKDPEQFLKDQAKLFLLVYSSPFPYHLTINNFEFLYQIGRGAFGVVVLVRYKMFGSYYAMKALRKKTLVEKQSVDRALNEKTVLQSLNCPFTVYLLYFSQDNINIYFILPFICGGELFQHMKQVEKLSTNVAKFYAAQVILAFEYLHRCDVIYRDLKPENILLDHNGYLKITDFGLSKVVPNRTYTFCGTPEFLAPEIIMGCGYGKSVDWWSLGVLIYEMNSGETPFEDVEIQGIIRKASEGEYDMPDDFSDSLKDLVGNLLQVDVTRRLGNIRPGVEGIKNHEWFKDINWLALLNREVMPPFVPSGCCLMHPKREDYPEMKKISYSDFMDHRDKDEHKHLFSDF